MYYKCRQFYGKTYGAEWPSLRLALLSRQKFAALVNRYAGSSAEETRTRLMKMGCYSVTKQYQHSLQEFMKGKFCLWFLQGFISETTNRANKLKRSSKLL